MSLEARAHMLTTEEMFVFPIGANRRIRYRVYLPSMAVENTESRLRNWSGTSIDADDVIDMVDELGKHKLNGREIRIIKHRDHREPIGTETQASI